MFKFNFETFIITLVKSILGKKNYIKLRFRITNGYWPNLKKPETFNEKIQIRKLYGNYEFYSDVADKVSLREYIKNTIGEEYLIPSYGIYNKLNPKIIEKLPNQFVIKSSHGSGKRFLEIIKNKNNSNIKHICEKFNSAQKIKFGERQDELFYSVKEPKILIEKLLLDKKGKVPADYKFHCFNSDKGFDYCLEVILDRFEAFEEVWVDSDWGKIDFKVNKKNKKTGSSINKPENLDEIINIIKKLSKPFDYVRIDLYLENEKIYVGEMTFAEASGYYKMEPKEIELYLGKKWKMDKNTYFYKKEKNE